jgi:hypothetical protein
LQVIVLFKSASGPTAPAASITVAAVSALVLRRRLFAGRQWRSRRLVASTQSYDSRVAGVISPQPGIAPGDRGASRVLVAATGRVQVKVDASNGPIRIGDLLVTSDKEGFCDEVDAG